VKRMWQKALGAAAVGLMLAATVSGCMARPAPRPGAGSSVAGVDPALSTAVAHTAKMVGGAGDVEAVVIDNVALVAIQMNAAQPGGTQGNSLIGNTKGSDAFGTNAGAGPTPLQGPGASTGTSTALPGGGINPGGVSPGGTPNSTQAIPNSTGGPALQQGGTNAAPAPNPGSVGAAPFDVMTRIANRIKTDHRQITEVRFAWAADDAHQLAAIARGIQAGNPPAGYLETLRSMKGSLAPAGTTQMDPAWPPQGTYPTRER
jgi:hypothetical protein